MEDNVVFIRPYRDKRDGLQCPMTQEQARKLHAYIEFKRWNKKAMQERDAKRARQAVRSVNVSAANDN